MIFKLFSQRKKEAQDAGVEDVYQYTTVSKALRVQTAQILTDAIGPEYIPSAYSSYTLQHNPNGWELIHKTLAREIGVHRLGNDPTKRERVLDHLQNTDTAGFLDAVELSLRYIDKVIRDVAPHAYTSLGIVESPDCAIEEINYRFRQASLGFQFESGFLIELSETYIHDQITKPALAILSPKCFDGPREEFLNAHSFYKDGKYSQAITESAKSFESTLKAICDLKKWHYNKGSRISDLLKIVRENNLWPDFMDKSFDQLIATLQSGLAKLRDEKGAHGQGAEIKQVPDYVAAYALHLAASKIVFVVKAAENTDQK